MMTHSQKVDVATFVVMALLSGVWFVAAGPLSAPFARRSRFKATGALVCASVLLIGNVSPFDSLGAGAEISLTVLAIIVGL
jgi:hypothetical protein